MRGCFTKVVVLLVILVAIAAAVLIIDRYQRRGQASPGTMATDTAARQDLRTDDGIVCAVTEQGRVPKKIVVVTPDPAVYSTPDRSAAARHPSNELFSTLYVFEERGDFVLAGRSPYDRTTLGWIHQRDVLRWNTREGIDPFVRDEQPLPLWETLAAVRARKPHDYDAGLGSERVSQRVLRILGRDGDSYHVAMLYDVPGERWQVTRAWTGPVEVGFDAKLVYFVTRTSLQDDIEHLQEAWFKLQAGDDAADNSLLQYLRRDLGIRIGPGVDSQNATWGWIQEKLRALNVPIEGYSKQPTEIRRDLVNRQNQITKLVEFHRNPSNWEPDGSGWLPADLVPMGGASR